MSQAGIWLLLFAVVAVVLLFSALYKRQFTVREMTMIGIMAALSHVAYSFFRIKLPGGSSFHLGNTFTALTALLLDGVSGGLAGAIGLAMADILVGDAGYAVTTFILKFIIGIVCGFTAHNLLHLKQSSPTEGKAKHIVRVTAAAASGLMVNVLTDPLVGFFRNRYIFGQDYTLAQAVSKIAGGVTFVNSLLSTVCVVVLYLALAPALEKAGLLNQSAHK